MQTQIQRLASVRLLVGITMLTMGLGMASCQQMAVVEPKTSVASDSTSVPTFADDDPPERPPKPGGN